LMHTVLMLRHTCDSCWMATLAKVAITIHFSISATPNNMARPAKRTKLDHQLIIEDKGFCVIPGVLTSDQVAEAIDELDYYRRFITDKSPPHGIHRFEEAGHQRHAWLVRTNPAVQSAFKALLKTDDLITSFDGYCHIEKSDSRRDTNWVHTDQSPAKESFAGYQGFVSLTDNSERTFVAYEGSHLDHEAFFQRLKIDNNHKHYHRDWHKIDDLYIQANQHKRKVVAVKAGDLVIWDSRTFHCNQYGRPNCEKRVVQYVSFQPRHCEANTVANQRKRRKYFAERRTTSHWCAPIRVNGLQPQVFGDSSKLLDYSKLPQPILDELPCSDLI